MKTNLLMASVKRQLAFEQVNETIQKTTIKGEIKMNDSKMVTIQNVSMFALPLYKWNKSNGFNVKYSDIVSYVFGLQRQNRFNDIESLKSIQIEVLAPVNELNGDIIEIVEQSTITSVSIPVNVLNVFGETVYNTVNELVSNLVNGSTGNKGQKYKGRLKVDSFDYMDGIQALNNLTGETVQSYDWDTFKEINQTPIIRLQTILVTYFLKDTLKAMINKTLSMGINYKKLNNMSEETILNMFSYQNASVQSGNIRQYEIDEIYNCLLVDAMRLEFDKLENINFFFFSLYRRLSNVFRVNMKKLRGQTQVSLDADDNSQVILVAQNVGETYIEKAEKELNDMGLNEKDVSILSRRIQGYKKKEIAFMDGFSQNKYNRDFKRLEDMLNMEDFEQAEKEALENAKTRKMFLEEQAIINEMNKEEDVQTFVPVNVSPINGVNNKVKFVKTSTNKVLPNINLGMIEENERLAKFKKQA